MSHSRLTGIDARVGKPEIEKATERQKDELCKFTDKPESHCEGETLAEQILHNMGVEVASHPKIRFQFQPNAFHSLHFHIVDTAIAFSQTACVFSRLCTS